MTPARDPLDPSTLTELRRLARSRARSGREASAKIGAIRTLERIGRQRRPAGPMPDDWHPLPGSEWEQLDAADPIERRQTWHDAFGRS